MVINCFRGCSHAVIDLHGCLIIVASQILRALHSPGYKATPWWGWGERARMLAEVFFWPILKSFWSLLQVEKAPGLFFFFSSLLFCGIVESTEWNLITFLSQIWIPVFSIKGLRFVYLVVCFGIQNHNFVFWITVSALNSNNPCRASNDFFVLRSVGAHLQQSPHHGQGKFF